MIIKQYLFLWIIGISAGAIIAAGVVALITSTGIVTRMADKTHTGKFIRGYETIIIAGVILWNLFWVYDVRLNFTNTGAGIMQCVLGIFQGIFVGSLAVSLAEALDATAIVSRRVKLCKGIGFIILFAALGKALFSTLQFIL